MWKSKEALLKGSNAISPKTYSKPLFFASSINFFSSSSALLALVFGPIAMCWIYA
jgi:hypothetical protein